MMTKAWFAFEVVLVCVRRGLALVHPETEGGGAGTEGDSGIQSRWRGAVTLLENTAPQLGC